MTDQKPTKRRAVSKARLYVEIQNAVVGHALTESATVEELLNELKDDIVTEALGK